MRGIEEITTGEILSEAVKHHKADKSAGDEVPKHLDTEIAVDPAEVAKGKEGEAEKIETDEEKAAREKAEAEAEVYIPDDPKKPEVKPVDKPADKPVTPAKDADIEAFEAKLRANGYEDDAIADMLDAVELGGKQALKRMEAARAEENKATQAESEKRTEEMADRRRVEFQSVGRLQQDGRLPKVPVEIQKKLAEGKNLTEAETKHPGVMRQNDIWGFMATENKKVAKSGNGYYITNFAQALDLFEAKELRAGGAEAAKRETEVRAAKARKLAGGNNGGGGTAKTPGYIRGQSLDEIAASIQKEYRAG